MTHVIDDCSKSSVLLLVHLSCAPQLRTSAAHLCRVTSDLNLPQFNTPHQFKSQNIIPAMYMPGELSLKDCRLPVSMYAMKLCMDARPYPKMSGSLICKQVNLDWLSLDQLVD